MRRRSARQGDVGPLAGQVGFGVEPGDVKTARLCGKALAGLRTVVWRRPAHPLDPDLQCRAFPAGTAVQGQHAAEPGPAATGIGGHRDGRVTHAGASGDPDVRVSGSPADNGLGHDRVGARLGDGIQNLGGRSRCRASARGCGPFLAGMSTRGLPDQPWDQRAGAAAAGPVLADLHRQNLHPRASAR